VRTLEDFSKLGSSIGQPKGDQAGYHKGNSHLRINLTAQHFVLYRRQQESQPLSIS
jgi:hypothetical protein